MGRARRQRQRADTRAPYRIAATLIGLVSLVFYAIVRSGLPGVVGYERGLVYLRPGALRLAFPYALLALVTVGCVAALVALSPGAKRLLRSAVARAHWTALLALGLLAVPLLPWGYSDLWKYAWPNYYISFTHCFGVMGFLLVGWGIFGLLRRAGRVLVVLWDRVLAVPPRWFALGCAAFTLTVAATVSLAVFGAIPHITDAAAQLFQAKIFASGRLFVPSPGFPSFFDFKHVINEGRWYSQYPFGHPLMLTLGVLARLPWLVNPLQAAVAALALYGLGREVYGERVGRVAALLFCLSPFIWFMSGSFMNHTTSMCWGTLFLLFVSRLGRRGIGNALLAGLALGMVVATRPATALAFGLPAAVWAVFRLRREPRLVARAGAATAVVAVAGVLLLVQNWLTNGAPMSFGYTLLHGPGHGFVFGPAALGITHTPLKGFVNLTNNLAGLNRFMLEWPIPALALPLVLVATRTRRAWDWLLFGVLGCLLVIHFFYFFHGYCYGPRFVFEAVPGLLLLSARALPRGIAAVRRFAGGRTSRIQAALAGLIGLAIIIGWAPGLPQLVREYRKQGGVTPRTPRLVRAANLSKALVFTSDYNSVFALNRPDLSGPVVFARDLGQLNPLLTTYFPDREAWLAEDGLIRLPALGQYADSLLRELAEARSFAAEQARSLPGYRTLVWPLDKPPAGVEPGEPPLTTLRELNGRLHRRETVIESIVPALVIAVSNDFGRPFDDLGPLRYTYSGRHYYMNGLRVTDIHGTPARYCWVYDVRAADDSTPVVAVRPATPVSPGGLAELQARAQRLLPWDVKSVLWPTDLHRPDLSGTRDTGAPQVVTYARLFQGIERGDWNLEELLPATAYWVEGSYEQHPEVTGFMAERESYRVGGYYFTLLAASPDSSMLAYVVQSRVGEALNRLSGTVAAMLHTRYNTVFWPAPHMAEPGQLLVKDLARTITSYRDAYASIDSGHTRFTEYLPAVCFWELHNLGRHPPYMRAMDSGESYEMSDMRFTLLIADPDSIAAAYLVERIR